MLSGQPVRLMDNYEAGYKEKSQTLLSGVFEDIHQQNEEIGQEKIKA